MRKNDKSHQNHFRLRLHPQEQRVPSLPRSPQRVPRRGFLPLRVDARLAALRFPCSRLHAQGLPSVANPFSGIKVHWTFTYIRFTPLAPLLADAVQDARMPRAQGCVGAAFVSVGIRLGVRRKAAFTAKG